MKKSLDEMTKLELLEYAKRARFMLFKLHQEQERLVEELRVARQELQRIKQK